MIAAGGSCSWAVPAGDDAGFEVEHPDGPGAPVVVHVPHASTAIPDDVRADILLDDDALADELRRITDHRTDLLTSHAVRRGATRFVNRRSRLVVDPERFPDPAQEVMESRGMGAVYTSTTTRSRLRHDDVEARRRLLSRYFAPYAEAFAEVVARQLDVHDRCTIVDVHSYPSVRLPYEVGDEGRPDICIGTDPSHTPDWLRALVADTARSHGFATADDTPFSGAYVPLDRYQRDHRVAAVMLEIRRDLYLDEATAQPHAGEQQVAGFLDDVVAAIAS